MSCEELEGEIKRLITKYEGFATSNDPKSINRAIAEVLKSLLEKKK